MAEKELHRLRRRELLQMLLEQCEETERLQQESEDTNRQLRELEERYERLLRKLNIKDERLNQKDAKIAKLNSTIEEMRASRAIELEEAGSIAEASLRLNGIFEAAQRSAEQYLMNVKRLSEKAEKEYKGTSGLQLVERRKQMEERQQIPFESGWKTVTRRNRLHG